MLYPLKFEARFVEKIWGGDQLAKVMGKKLPAGKKIGESWEISAVEGEVSVVANGKLKGNSLQDLIEVYMGDLVGDKIYERFGVEFPLLVKLLDAQDVLSIQVHPNDEMARERHNSYGKNEMWYVVDSAPDGALYVGFKGKVTRKQYLDAVEKGNLPELLNKIAVKPGDAFYIPAGTIHAIGKGCLIAEIQQTSDITYRVDDWGRLDDEGKPREMHTELAVDVIEYDTERDLAVTVSGAKNSATKMVATPYFTTNQVALDGELDRNFSGTDSFVIYMVLEGKVEIDYGNGSEKAKKGETVLLPAQFEHITLRGEATLLESYIES